MLDQIPTEVPSQYKARTDGVSSSDMLGATLAFGRAGMAYQEQPHRSFCWRSLGQRTTGNLCKLPGYLQGSGLGRSFEDPSGVQGEVAHRGKDSPAMRFRYCSFVHLEQLGLDDGRRDTKVSEELVKRSDMAVERGPEGLDRNDNREKGPI